MAQIVRYTGDSTFRMLQLGIDVSPNDPLHEVDDDVASYLIQNHPFEAYDGLETDVPTTLYSLFVSGEDINPTSVGKETPADLIAADALDIVEDLGLPKYDDISDATQSAAQFVYATGDGPSAEGVYVHDGTEFIQIPFSSEAVRDTVADFVTAGADISVTHDDGGDALTIGFTGTNYSAEKARDDVGAALAGGSNVTVSVDDANDTITISLNDHASTHEKGGADELTDFGDTTHDSVETGAVTDSAAEGVPKSVSTALQSGNAIAVTSGGPSKSVNIAGATSAASAIQSLVDWIETNHKSGTLYIPLEDGNGNAVSIDSTVSTSSSSSVPINIIIGPESASAQGGNGGRLQSTINDGSAVFDIIGDQTNGPNARITLICSAFDAGGNDCSLFRTRYVNNSYIFARCMSLGGPAIHIDSNSFDNQVEGFYAGANTNAQAVLFSDNENDGIPADTVIGPWMKTEGTMGNEVDCTNGNKTRVVGGRFEAADGNAPGNNTASLHNAGNGRLYVTKGVTLGPTANGAHGIFLDVGGVLDPGEVNSQSGDGIVIGANNTSNYYISPTINFETNITGNAITVNNDPTGVKQIVPYENNVNGAVSYPSAPWSSVHYPDGWRKYRTASDVTVASGGTAKLTGFAGRPDSEIKYNVFIDSDPNAAVGYQSKVIYNDTDEQVEIHGIETESTGNSVDLGCVVYRRGSGVNLR